MCAQSTFFVFGIYDVEKGPSSATQRATTVHLVRYNAKHACYDTSVRSKLDDSLHPFHVLHLGGSLSGPLQVGNAEVDVVKADHIVGSRLRDGRALAIGIGKVRHHVDRPVVRVCGNVEEPSRLFPILAILCIRGERGDGGCSQ